MSKGANSSLPSGGTDRGIPAVGDSNGDVKDNKHGDKLDAGNTSKEEHAVHPGQSIASMLPATTVHVAE